jgi:ribosomal-protein-alanine N-acetyltransferase
MNVLETERLILRHYCLDDVEALAALYADPQFTRFLDPPTSKEDIRADLCAFIEEYKTVGYGFYATLLKPDGLFIGRCGLLRQWIEGVKEVEVAYGIAPAYWGQGLATEAAGALKEYAFETLGCSRVISLVDKHNLASQRVAEKNGMSVAKTILLDGHECFLYVVQKESETTSSPL